MMKKYKFNFYGLLAILGVIGGFAILIHDFIAICGCGASYTPFGMTTLLIVLLVASESIKYIEDRLDR